MCFNKTGRVSCESENVLLIKFLASGDTSIKIQNHHALKWTERVFEKKLLFILEGELAANVECVCKGSGWG